MPVIDLLLGSSDTRQRRSSTVVSCPSISSVTLGTTCNERANEETEDPHSGGKQALPLFRQLPDSQQSHAALMTPDSRDV